MAALCFQHHNNLPAMPVPTKQTLWNKNDERLSLGKLTDAAGNETQRVCFNGGVAN